MSPRSGSSCVDDEAPDDVSYFELFLLELQRIPEQEFTVSRVLKLLQSFAGCKMYLRKRDLVKPHRIRMAAHLMRSGISRADAARMLSATLEVSESTAYRIITKALGEQRK